MAQSINFIVKFRYNAKVIYRLVTPLTDRTYLPVFYFAFQHRDVSSSEVFPNTFPRDPKNSPFKHLTTHFDPQRYFAFPFLHFVDVATHLEALRNPISGNAVLQNDWIINMSSNSFNQHETGYAKKGETGLVLVETIGRHV